MVSVPVPFLVRVPAAPVLMPVVLMVVFPKPPTVRAKPVPVMPPVSVSVPESELMVAAEPSVIAPLHVLLFAGFSNAPKPPPVPFRVIGSAMLSPVPLSSTFAPLTTVVAPATVPRAVLF